MKRDEGIVRVETRAVDVGYFNVKYTLGRKDKGGSTEIATGLYPALAPRLATNLFMQSPGTARSDGCVVEVDGVNYFVGRGAVFYSSGMEPRPVLDDYSLSDKYLALLRGALNYMAIDAGATQELTIEQLVLGLPLNTYQRHHAELAARAEGAHVIADPVGGSGARQVVVEKAQVIVQPQGALIHFGVQHRMTGQDGWALVVDPGGGTLDWFLSRGREPNWQRSGAYPKSMLACANAVADKIDPSWKDQFEIIERIDLAIRTRADSFKVGGQVYKMAEFQQSVDAVLDEAVDYMLSVVGPTANLDHILLTGGGAGVFFEHIVRHHPKLQSVMRIDEDPVFSNVRGFQIAGEIFNARRG